MVTHGLNSREWFTTNYSNWVSKSIHFYPGAGSDFTFVRKSSRDDLVWSTRFINDGRGWYPRFIASGQAARPTRSNSLSLSPCPAGQDGKQLIFPRAYVDQLDAWDEVSGSERFENSQLMAISRILIFILFTLLL